MAVDLMVMPRSCSSFLVSVNRLIWSVRVLVVLIFHILFTGFCGGDNTSTLDEGIGQGGFAVVDVGCWKVLESESCGHVVVAYQ